MEKVKFSFIVEAVYSIIGRGTIVIGQVEHGEVNQGDYLDLIGSEKPLKTKCLSIEKNCLFVKKKLKQASVLVLGYLMFLFQK